MRSLLIGCGGIGCTTLENLIQISPSKLTPLAIDTDPRDLRTLQISTENGYDPLLLLNADPYSATPERGLNVATTYKWRIAAKIEEALDQAGSIDSFTLIAGVGGTTGAGMIPLLAHILKENYFEDQYPLILVCMLPPQGDPYGAYNALYALQTLTRELNYDGLILASNTPQETARQLAPLYTSPVIGRRDIIPLLQMGGGLSTLGLTCTSYKGSKKLAETIKTQVIRTLNSLLVPAQLNGGTRGLIIVRTPPIDDRETLEPARQWINANIGGVFRIIHQQNSEEIEVFIVATGLNHIPRLEDIIHEAERVRRCLNTASTQAINKLHRDLSFTLPQTEERVPLTRQIEDSIKTTAIETWCKELYPLLIDQDPYTVRRRIQIIHRTQRETFHTITMQYKDENDGTQLTALATISSEETGPQLLELQEIWTENQKQIIHYVLGRAATLFNATQIQDIKILGIAEKQHQIYLVKTLHQPTLEADRPQPTPQHTLGIQDSIAKDPCTGEHIKYLQYLYYIDTKPYPQVLTCTQMQEYKNSQNHTLTKKTFL